MTLGELTMEGICEELGGIRQRSLSGFERRILPCCYGKFPFSFKLFRSVRA